MQKDKIVSEAEDRMKHAMEHAQHEIASVRTSKATPALLDTVRVNAYGSATPLQQLALVSAPEPRLLVVQPWDRTLVKEVVRAIQGSELGLNPLDDGTVIRVPIPALTEERRKELVKLCGKLVEEGRVSVRNVRRDAMEHLKKKKKEGEVSEDDERKAEKELQQVTDRMVARLDEILNKKTAEIMEV
jgi:ribosome recycling factor